jgi:hypothetical protein
MPFLLLPAVPERCGAAESSDAIRFANLPVSHEHPTGDVNYLFRRFLEG